MLRHLTLHPACAHLPCVLRHSCTRQACCRAHSRAGSHLQREVLAAEDDSALLALVRRAARQQRFDPPSIVVAIQRVSHLIERSGSGTEDSRTARQLLEDALLVQLPAFSVEQAASALASVRNVLPSEAARAALLNGIAQHSGGEELHQASTEHVVLLLSAFVQLGGRAGGVSPVVDDFLGRLMAELQLRILDGPVLHLTPLADAQIPAASWAIASAYAPAPLRHQWQNRSLISLQGFSPPQPSSHTQSEPPRQESTAASALPALPPVNSMLTATDNAAAAEAKPPDVQSGVVDVMDALASRARMHLMNQHSAKATFSPSDLAALTGSFALLGHYSGDVSQALDAVLGFARRRIDARHLNAVSRLDHTAQLLWSLAMLQHRTLATRELLSASSSELAHKLSSETMLGVSRGGVSAAAGGQLGQTSDTAHLTAILSAHWHLGYRPSEKLLVAVGPFLCRRAAQLTQEQKHDLTHLLFDFEHDPGNSVQQVLCEPARL